MEIITLQEYTDQYVSLYEGQIRNLPNDLALRLINKGVAAQHDKDILNSTTTQDNGKILTVVNGKPAFIEKTSELPKVTASDNGDVLKVVGGKWAKAEASGDTVTVSLTYDEETEMVIMDKTWNELRLMLASGQRVIAVNNNGDGEISPIYTAQKQVMTASQSANLDNYYVAVAHLEVLGGNSEGVGEMFIEVFSCTSPDEYPSMED